MIFKIAWLYYDLLEIYSDGGNLKVVESILKDNEIKYTVDKVTINDNVDLSTYDFIFIGGGTDLNQSILSDDLMKRKENIQKALDNKTFILTICGGYQMFGKYYKDHLGNKIKCLDIFDYYTKSDKRCVGNILVKPNQSLNMSGELVGFENHGGHTENVESKKTLGKVIKGCGNNSSSGYEGYIDDFFIGTYMHGPFLPKNPEIVKYIIEKILKEKYNIEKKIKIKYLAESLEAKREVIF